MRRAARQAGMSLLSDREKQKAADAEAKEALLSSEEQRSDAKLSA